MLTYGAGAASRECNSFVFPIHFLGKTKSSVPHSGLRIFCLEACGALWKMAISKKLK